MNKNEYLAEDILAVFDEYVANEITDMDFEDSVYEICQEYFNDIPKGIAKELDNMSYAHKNIRMERILQTLFEKLDYVNIDELEDFIEKL